MTEASWLEPLVESQEGDQALALPFPGCTPAFLTPITCQDPAHMGKEALGAGTLIPSAQRFVWAAKQPLGSAALGALFA